MLTIYTREIIGEHQGDLRCNDRQIMENITKLTVAYFFSHL